MAGVAAVKLPSTKAKGQTRVKKSTKQMQETFTLIAPTGWDNIPEELLASIFHLARSNDLPSLRGVCTNWKRVIEFDKTLSTKLKYTFNSVESFQSAVTALNVFGVFSFSSVSFKTDSIGYKNDSAKTFFKTTHPQVLHLEFAKKSENNHTIPPTTIQSIIRLFPNLKFIKMDDFTSSFFRYLVEKVSVRATIQLAKIFENITVFKLTCSFHVHHSISKAFNPQQFEILLKKLPQLNTLLYKRENSFGYYGSRAPITQQRDMEILKGIYSHMKKYPGILRIISFDVPVMVTKVQTTIAGFSILNLFHIASEHGIIIKNYYFPLEELLQAENPLNTNNNNNNNANDNNNNIIMRNPQELLPLNQLNFQSIQNASFRITSTDVYSNKAWDLILKCSSLKCLILIIDSDPVNDLSFLKYFPALKKLNLKIVSRPISSVEEALFQSQLFEQKLFPLESFEVDQRSTFFTNGRRVQNLFASPTSFLRFCETYSQLQELTLINCPCGTDYYCIGIILNSMKSLRILKLEGIGDSSSPDSTFILNLPRSSEEQIITINNQLSSISPMYEARMMARMENEYGSANHLQQLELKGMNFTDISVHNLICGLHLKSLFIRNCSNITDLSLRAIASVGPLRKTLKHFKIFGSACTILGLDALIRNCENLTCVEFQCPNIKAAGFIEYANSAYLGTTVKLASD